MSMNNTISREQVSALADNELADSQVDMALALLRQPEGQTSWDVYHQIGDILRSDEMAIPLSPDFNARMAARLAAEPVIVAPASIKSSGFPESCVSTEENKVRSLWKRFTVPGALAAAAASVALITAPQLMVAVKDRATGDSDQTLVTASGQPVSQGAIVAASMPQEAVMTSAAAPNGTILRDPHIDEYLRAHQRFSPSVYSSAHFARSATLAHESEK